MKSSNLLQLTPLATTIGIVVYSIIETKTKTGIDPNTGLPLTYNVIDGIKYSSIGLSFVLAMALLKIRFWKHFFTIWLLIATLGWIQFYPTTIGFDFGFIGIRMTGLFLLMFQLALNREPIDDLMKKIGMTNTDERSQTVPTESGIAIYLRKYAEKSEHDLQEIIESGNYTSEAIEAAKRILKKKKTAHNQIDGQ